MYTIFFSLFFSFLSLTAQGSEPDSSLAPLLLNIIPSHGILEPPFNPKTFSYDISLLSLQPSVAVIPEYKYDDKNTIVVMVKSDQTDSNSFSPYALRPQWTMPSDSGPLKLQFKIYSISNPDLFTLYNVQIRPKLADTVVQLNTLEATQNTNSAVSILMNKLRTVYNLYVDPSATYIILAPNCAPNNHLLVNGKSVSAGKTAKILRDKSQYQQLATVTCYNKSVYKQYVILIMSNHSPSAIKMPKISMPFLNKSCQNIPGTDEIECPLADNTGETSVRFLTEGDPTVKYSIMLGKNDMSLTLLNNHESSPFLAVPNTKYTVLAEAGQYRKTWKMTFTGLYVPQYVQIFGLLTIIGVVFYIISVVFICGIGNLYGIGFPIGASESLSFLLIFMQVTAFTQNYQVTLLGSKLFNYIRWATLFWPAPSYEMQLRDFVDTVGIFDVPHARGCLLWAGLILGSIICLHLLAILSYFIGETQTFPHGMKLGSWEQRLVYLLELPVVVASVILIQHDSQIIWRLSGALCILSYISWALTYYNKIETKIQEKSITWIWHYPLNQMLPDVDHEMGYWSDVVCDQLSTQPVNRSTFGKFFPWMWTATVADIQPVNICCEVYNRGASKSTDSNSMYDAYGDGAVPFGVVGRHVDVLQTVGPNFICPGQRLICGLLRCDWLDILFSYKALTMFYISQHKEMSKKFVTIPLTVKTHQLIGHFSGGLGHFFLDGVNFPYLRIIDSLCRCGLGLLIGLSMSSDSPNYNLLSIVACIPIAVVMASIYFVKVPHARKTDNILGGFLYTYIIFSICNYIAQLSNLPMHGQITAINSYVITAVLLIYTGYTYFSALLTFCAVLCPSLEEVRLLENFANCNVTISDHTENWAVELPGYSKRKIRDVKAQCSVGSDSKVMVSIFPSGEDCNLEFSVHDIAEACSTETLPVPSIVVFMSDSTTVLGYRWLNVYDESKAFNQIKKFLHLNERSRLIADSIAKSLTHQLQTGDSYNKFLMCVTVVLSLKKNKLCT